MLVCLDPGHGGNDPGAIGATGLFEKSVTLSVTLKVGKILTNHGIKVLYTRTTDVRLGATRNEDLQNRVRIANNANANYFISIHTNSATNPSANGTETFTYKQGTEGDRLAKSIQSNLIKEIKLTDRGVKYSNFMVISATKMPAALTELAFINNPSEEKLLRDESFLDKCAVGIAKGILQNMGVDYVVKEEKQIDEISEWAKDARTWVMEKGISDGTNPKGIVTREQLWAMLYRKDGGK